MILDDDVEAEQPEPVRPTARSGTFRRVMENLGWLLAGKGVGALLSLVYLGLATRALGLEGFGRFVLVLGTAQFTQSFVSFQIWQAVVRFGVDAERRSREEVGRLLSFCLMLDMASALIGCLIAAAGVFLLGPWMGWSAELQIEALIFCIVTLVSIRSTAIGILRLHDRFGRGAAADAMMPVMRLIGTLIVVFVIGPSIAGFLAAWAISEVATALTYWIMARRTGDWRLDLRPASLGKVPREHPGLWHFVAVTNVGTTLGSVSKQVTVLLVGLAVGPAAAGAYRLAHQLGQALARVSDLLSRAFFAEIARVHAAGSSEHVGSLFRSTSRLALGAGAIIIALLVLVGEPILRLVAGAEFAHAYPLLLLLGSAAAIDMVGVGFEPALMATGRAGVAFRLRLAVTAFLLTLLAVLLPLYGEMGAASATLIAAIVGLLLFGWVANRAISAAP